MKLWNEGCLNELVREGRTIQSRLPKFNTSKAQQSLSRSFANLMFAGKIKAALELLSKAQRGGILHLSDPSDPSNPESPTVKDVLNSKHPQGQHLNPAFILPSAPQEVHPVIFESLDAGAIRSAALRTSGSAGPSGLDAKEWRRLCTALKGASSNLCNSMALLAKRLSTTYIDPECISPLLACRLIALDKNPGVRPIGIGDTARRIIAKAVLYIVKTDVQDACGCVQLCGGQISGIEAAAHAVRSAYESDDNEGLLLANASNAFNSLNRQVALHNIQRICPSLSTILINTYRAPTELFVDGDTILSQEGTTQGDPLAMPTYALATIPLIQKLEGNHRQVWYADDAAAVGKILDLRDWWERLSTIGPSYGYFPNASKTWLVIKEGLHETARSIFANTGVNVTCSGRPYLGASIGSEEYVAEQVKLKVSEWTANLKSLATIAETQPHAAFAALTHGLTSKWTYLSRTVPGIGPLLGPLDEALHSVLLPALLGRPPPSDQERTLFALPARLGGLGVGIPSTNAAREFRSSSLITSSPCDHILSQDPEYGLETVEKQLEAKAQVRRENNERTSTQAIETRKCMPDSLQRAMDLASEKGASAWLTALPLMDHGFALHKRGFHDALAIRYGWTPSEMPSTCVCGSKSSVEHALSCAKGGFPSIRHNEIRDMTATLLTEVCHGVCIELGLQPVPSEALTGATANHQDGARLDITASGFWGGTYERTFFDVRVFNPHAPSNRQPSLASSYRRHEQTKKRAYEQRCREVEHASFTPLVMSATGGLAKEATTFYKRLASMLAHKWDHSYSSTLRWLRCRLNFSLLRSSIQALRGSRSSIGHPVKAPVVIDLVNIESRILSESTA